MRNTWAQKIQWSGSTVHSYAVLEVAIRVLSVHALTGIYITHTYSYIHINSLLQISTPPNINTALLNATG